MTNSPSAPGFDLGALGNMLGNINLPALANMLGGININQLLPIVTRMMSGGLGGAPQPAGVLPVQNPGPGVPPLPYGQIPLQPEFNPMALIPQPYIQDPRVVVLNTMKPFLPPDKCRIIDSILGVLGVIFTVNAVLPHRPIAAPPPPAPAPVQPPPPPPPPTPQAAVSTTVPSN